MSKEAIKINKLGKPMLRSSNGTFAKGNQEGMIYGKDHQPKGRPKGSKNMMSLIRDVALTKSARTGFTNIETVTISLIACAKKMRKIISEMDDSDPKKFNNIARHGELCAKIIENLSKFSGEYSQKIQAQISDELSDEEKKIVDEIIKKQADVKK